MSEGLLCRVAQGRGFVSLKLGLMGCFGVSEANPGRGCSGTKGGGQGGL